MRILFVDAGNYCRSPVAEVVARTQAARAALRSWSFGSAGLKDKHVGSGADPRSIAVAASRGYDLEAFRCRRIEPRDFVSFDWILAMDEDNRSQLEALRPAGCPVPITLLLRDREVPDPYFGGPAGFVTMLEQIELGVRELLESP
jgi:protein-tyrosine phosphatase